MASISVFQTEDTGSIPVTGSGQYALRIISTFIFIMCSSKQDLVVYGGRDEDNLNRQINYHFCRINSTGRVFPLQGKSWEFKSLILHLTF